MRRWVALAAILITVASCGSSGTSSPPSPSPSPVVTTPASTPSPAALVFKLSGVGAVKATGTMTVTTQAGSVTVELKITGLQAASIHVSHIHIGSCAGRGAIKYALNPVVVDGQGDADVKSTVKAIYPPTSGSWYVVVHAGPDMNGTNAKYLLCGNLFK
jgi:CHRD domain-containing protein